MSQLVGGRQVAACAKCRSVSPLYCGDWGGGGLCRSCIDGLPPAARVETLRRLSPRDHAHWRVEALWGEERTTRDAGQPLFRERRVRGAPGRGAKERRVYPRVEARVPAGVCFPPSVAAADECGKTSLCTVRDLSVGGLRVWGADPALFALSAESRVQLDVSLHPPTDRLTCHGVVRYVGAGGDETGGVGIEFVDLTRGQIASIHRFLATRPPLGAQLGAAAPA